MYARFKWQKQRDRRELLHAVRCAPLTADSQNFKGLKPGKLNGSLRCNSATRQAHHATRRARLAVWAARPMEVEMHIVRKLSLFAATAATVVASTAPALADGGRHRGRDGIDAGDVIAGALIIGGIAAIASAAANNDRRYGGRWDRDRDYDDRYESYGYYRNGYGSRLAVEQCVRSAGQRAGRFGRARVTDVTYIDRIRGGYEVRGRLVVAGRHYRSRDYDGWDRYGYHYDRYGRDYDKGKFACVVRYGEIQDIRLSGLRGSYY